jgi:fatty-acyl-CoA synthase
MKSYFHRGGGEPLLHETVWERFSRTAEKFGEREAIVSVHQNRRLTYSELKERATALGRGLLAMGFKRGDRIGVWSTNNVEWVIVQLASASVGALLVNINPAYRAKELEYALKNSDVSGLFVMPGFRKNDYVKTLIGLMPEFERPESCEAGLRLGNFPSLRSIVLFDPLALMNTKRPAPGFGLWQELLSAGEKVSRESFEAAASTADPDDPINIQYTSGTTGHPKAVVLTHNNIVNNSYFAARRMGFTERDRLCVPVPFYHCFGMVVSNLICFSVGASIVLPSEHFDARAVLKAIEAERCTALHGVPTMFMAELESDEFKRTDMSTLRTGIMAGAPCPEPLMRRVMTEMHIPEILIGYGQTEASPITHLTSPNDAIERRVSTVGTNLSHQEVKIVDPTTGATLPVGEVGDICFRGYHVMRGYYNDPSATREVLDDAGWLHSGDLGRMDKDGYVQITGRLRDMIIRGGENIYPAEIEGVLFSHPNVAEAAVIGVPDEFYGEEIMAWVKLKAGSSATEDEIRGFVKERLAHYKSPKYVWFVDEFPMTVTGKLQKFRMRETAMEKMKETK